MKDNKGNEIAMNTVGIKCNKSSLNKIIFMTSSRYNTAKKKDVIKDIIFHVEKGDDCLRSYESGVYTESGYRDGRKHAPNDKYTLEIKNGKAVLYNFTSDSYPVYSDTNAAYLLEKPLKNSYFIPVKKIYYNPEFGKKNVKLNSKGKKELFGVSEGDYDVYGQNTDYFFINHGGEERHVLKEDCTVLNGSVKL